MESVRVGNHLKMTVPERLRSQAREFYATVLGCRPLDSPRPDLDLYEFSGGFVLGLFFTSDAETLSEAEHLKATWMELKVEDPAALKTQLLAFGVREVEYPDPTRFFFQAPGGQVFRVAPLDGEL
jgi:hypothetical protein